MNKKNCVCINLTDVQIIVPTLAVEMISAKHEQANDLKAMRHFGRIKYLSGLILFCLLLGSCQKCPMDGMYEADIFFENGVVYTVDKDNTIAQSLAVKKGIIVFVGTARDGKKYKAAAKEIVDLKGGMLLPGFIDGHIHPITPDFFDFVHFEDASLDATLQRVKNYVDTQPDQDVYYGFGYNNNIFGEDEVAYGPKKEHLDDISLTKPIIILALDGHAAWLNSKAFEYCNITKDTSAPPGGEIVKNPDGELRGVLRDAAVSLAPDPVLPPDKLSSALLRFQSMLNAYGYTSIMVLPGNGYAPIYWEGFRQLEKSGQLNVRVRGAGIVKPWAVEEDLAALIKLKETYHSELLKLGAAKIFADGIIAAHSAYLLTPYYQTTSCGEAIWLQESLHNVCVILNALGVQLHTHAIGDAAVKMTLQAYDHTSPESRNVITHLQLVDPPDFSRFKALGAIAVVQPYWFFKQVNYWEPVEYAALGERAKQEWPLKSFVNADALFCFSSDYPVTADPNPFVAIEIGITRNLPGIADIDDPTYLLWPEERLDIQNMIRGFTANAAYSMFIDDITGTLEVGKYADLIVIDRDLFSTEPSEIGRTKVLRTYLKGKQVN